MEAPHDAASSASSASSIPPTSDLPRQRLEALYEIGRSLPALLDWTELLGRVVEVAVESLKAERGILFLRDADGSARPEVIRGADEATIGSALAMSQRILAHALSSGEATLSDDARADQRFDSPSVAAYNIVSFMCVPLRRGDRVIGTLYVDHRRVADLFARDDLAFLTALADLGAVAIENARLHAELQREVRQLRRDVAAKYRFENLLGSSERMTALFRTMERVADTDATVLIEGENGTGKGLIARALHANSRRRDRPFVTIDCGALNEQVAASELFGYRRGAFTDAREDRAGLFEDARDGTVFLDQIEDLPLALQSHLLRALQEGEVRRLGETAYRKVRWRAIAATRVDLAERVRAGSFREDLYYRLLVIPLRVPALRQRREDVAPLAHHFLEKAKARLGRGPEGFSAEALERLEDHAWPGNVRELEHTIDRACLLAVGSRIQSVDLGLPDSPLTAARTARAVRPGRSDAEMALREHGGNVSHAAAALGIGRRALQKLMRRESLDREDFTTS